MGKGIRRKDALGMCRNTLLVVEYCQTSAASWLAATSLPDALPTPHQPHRLTPPKRKFGQKKMVGCHFQAE